MNLFLLFLVFLITNSTLIFSQEESKTTIKVEESEEPIVKIKPTVKKEIPKPEKVFSIMPSIGFGRGKMEIEFDRSQPYTTPSEFVLLSLYGLSSVSSNAASTVAGNLSPQNFAGIIYVSNELKKNMYSANSNSVYNRFYIESREKKGENGFQFGISSGYFAINVDSSRSLNSILPSLLYGNSSPILNQFAVFSYLQSSQPFYTNITTFDFNSVKHFLPDEKIDLYISIGGGFGGCLVQCNALKFASKLGTRYNFNEEIFSYIEFELQYLFLISSDRKYSPIFEKTVFFGIGYNL